MFDDLENRFASHINPDDIVPVGQHIEDQTEKMNQIIERLDKAERKQGSSSREQRIFNIIIVLLTAAAVIVAIVK